MERKLESLVLSVTGVKSSVGFLDKKYENVLSQLQVTKERVTNRTTKIKEVQSDLANVKKDSHGANINLKDLAQYLRRDCLHK